MDHLCGQPTRTRECAWWAGLFYRYYKHRLRPLLISQTCVRVLSVQMCVFSMVLKMSASSLLALYSDQHVPLKLKLGGARRFPTLSLVPLKLKQCDLVRFSLSLYRTKDLQVIGKK